MYTNQACFAVYGFCNFLFFQINDFAQEEHTARQRTYAVNVNKRGNYHTSFIRFLKRAGISVTSAI